MRNTEVLMWLPKSPPHQWPSKHKSGRFEGLIKNCETQRKRFESEKNEMMGVWADNQVGEKSDNQRHSPKTRAADSTARMSP